MANGLRKLIRNANRFSKSAILAQRIQQQRRLQVEELEERVAPAALAAGEYVPYDTAGGTVGVLYNAGATSVDVTIVDAGGANALDTFVIDLNAAGAVSLIATDALSGTAGVLITDSANAALTLQTGIAVGNIGTLWGTGAGALDNGGDPGNGVAVGATGGDVTGSITLNNTTSAVTAITVTDGGTGTGALASAITSATSVGNTQADGVLSGSIVAGTTVGTTTSVNGNITATISGAGNIGNIDADSNGTGTITGAITSTSSGTIGTVSAGGTISGAITSAGTLGAITSTNGSISGAISAAGTIGAIDADSNGTGVLSSTITSTNSGNIGAVSAGGTISGAITSAGTLGAITSLNGSLTGVVTAAGNIGNVDADSNGTGTISGAITASGTGTIGTVSAGGTISGAITSGGTLGAITSLNGSITGALAAAGTIGAIDADSNGTGTLSGAVTSTNSGNIGNVATGGTISGAITSAGTIGTITSLDGSLTGNVSANGNIGAVTLDVNETAAGAISGTITTTNNGTIGFIDAGGNISAAITSAATIAGLRTDGNLSAAITAATGFITNAIQIDDGITAAGSLVATTGGFSANSDITIDTVGMAGAITAVAGGIAADLTVTAGGLGGAVLATAGGIAGNVLVTAGGLSGSVQATAGNIAGNVTVTAGGLTGTVTAVAGDLDGNVTVTAGGLGATGVLNAGINIDGNVVVTAGGVLAGAAITAGTNISGNLTVSDAGFAGNMTATTGNISGTIAITDGVSGTIVASAGNISGTITISDATNGTLSGTIQAGGLVNAATTIANGITSTGKVVAGTDIDSAITITAGGMAGAVTAGVNLDGALTVTAGGLTGPVTASTGNIGAGGITVTAGGISAAGIITAGADIDGSITATAGNIAATITAAQNIDGSIVATAGALSAAITATAGNLTSANITAGVGDIASIVVGGSILPTGANTVISAEDDVTSIVVTGAIGDGVDNVTITADSDDDNGGNIGTVTSGDDVDLNGGSMTGFNIGTVRSGGLVGHDITGTITAENDITGLIDAGDGTITATVTAQKAVGSSPLATWISGGVSYAVWAFNTGTTTVNTSITANVAFTDNTNPPSIAISQLANSGGTTPDIFVTTRADTGADQIFADPDVDIDSANLDVTVTALTPITIGTLNIEGNFAIGIDPDIQATTTIVEGGTSGTVAAAVGQNLSFGSVTGALTINVAGGGAAGTLTILGNTGGTAVTAGSDITVNGSLAGVNIGDASQGKTGNVLDGADITATGTLGDVNITGNLNGGLNAVSVGDVNVDGNIGDVITSDLAITGTGGNVGDVNATGSIGADAGNSVTIQSITNSVGLVSATGAIGAGNGGTSVVANTNIEGVQSASTIGDGATSVTITATNGTLGVVEAGGNNGGTGINAAITAGGNITAVRAIDPAEDQGGISGTITSNSGNIGEVSTIAHDISAVITATLGNVDSVVINAETGAADGGTDGVVDDGTISGNITAGGDIDTIAAQDITATIIGKAGTATSPIVTIEDGGVLYTADATSGPIYQFTYAGPFQAIDITVDNWDGTAALASSVNLNLTSTSAATGALVNNGFDLDSLNFDADSTTNSTNNLGTVTVEGQLGLLETGTLSALFVEQDVTLPVIVNSSSAGSPITAVAVGSGFGVEDPSATQLQNLFEDSDTGDSPVFAAPADATVFSVPVSNNSSGDDVSFAPGNAAGFDSPILLSAGDDGVNAWTVTYNTGGMLTLDSARTSDGDVTVDGDLETVIIALDLDTVTITGSILADGGLDAFNTNAITVGTAGDLTTGNVDGSIIVRLPSDPNGNLPGTADGDIDGSVVIRGSVGANGLIQVGGNLNGSVTIGQEIVVNGLLQNVGDFAGTLDVAGNVAGAFTVQNNFTGNYLVGGNSGAITSIAGNIGGSGLIVVGGGLTAVTANNGNISADLLIGGTSGGGDAVTLQAQSVSGDLSIGFVNGVDTLTVNLLEDNADTGNPFSTVLANTNNAGMHVEIAAGNITSTGTTVDQVTLIEDSTSLSAMASDGSVDITALYIIEDNSVTIDVSVPGTLGTVVAAEGASAVEGSQAHQDAFVAAYNTAEGTSVSVDVVNAPTAYDAVLDNNTDSAGIALTIDVFATSVTGGILSSGNLNVDYNDETNNDSMGWMVSLNGTVTANVNVDGSIGDIVAESTISGTLVAGTTIAVSGTVASPVDTDLTGALTTAFGSAIGSGVPTWFPGGVLSETGNSSASFTASGTQDLVTVNGTSFIASSGDAMGIVYAPMGDITGSYFLKGNFGGFQVPMGTVSVSGYVDANGFAPPQIIQVIADTYTFTPSGGAVPTPNLELVAGSDAFFVTASQPFSQTFVDGNNGNVPFVMNSVTVTGANTLVWVNADPDSDGATDLDEILVINGLEAGNTVDILGHVDDLVVWGDWAGSITLVGNPLIGSFNTTSSSEDNVFGIIYDNLTVKGDIDVATADLNAFKFPYPVHDGGFLNNGVAITDPSALDNSSMGDQFGSKLMDSSDRVLSWTNQNGKEQSLTLQGSKKITAEVDLFFGEVLTVDIQGKGNAGLVSAQGLSGSDSDIAKQAKGMIKAAGRMDDHPGFVTERAVLSNNNSISFNDDVNAVDYLESRNVGSASILEVRVGTSVGSETNLNGLVINGDADQVNGTGKAQNIWISGHVGEFDISSSVKKASFLDEVSEFKTNKAKDIKFLDSVRTFTATTASKILIDGDGETAANDDVSIFSVIKANNIDVKVGIDELHANRLNRFSVDGKVDNLIMYGGKQGRVTNSLFQDGVGSHNINYQKWIETSTTASGGAGGTGGSGGGGVGGTGGGGGNGAVGPVLSNLNASYNPIKVRNTSGLFGFAGRV